MTATDDVATGPGRAGVVLLHGIARTERSLRRMEQAVAAAGFATLNLNYPSRRAALATLADGLHPSITAFAAEVRGPLHFVAHSMGGLVTRVYLARHRPSRLGRVVMLGTPNGGSEVADLLRDTAFYRAAFGPAGQQLVTRRDAATKALLPPPDYPVGVIAGNRSLYPLASLVLPKPHDGRVSVRNTRIEGMHDHIVVATSHPQLAHHPAAIRQTLAFLQYGRFSHMA
ncbi:MAG: alpha/beta fold hydrolase [Pseudomonadota bacterium]